MDDDPPEVKSQGSDLMEKLASHNSNLARSEQEQKQIFSDPPPKFILKKGLDEFHHELEMTSSDEIQNIIQKEYGFEELTDVLSKLNYSQRNHNKHLAYLLNNTTGQLSFILNRQNEVVDEKILLRKGLVNVKSDIEQLRKEIDRVDVVQNNNVEKIDMIVQLVQETREVVKTNTDFIKKEVKEKMKPQVDLNVAKIDEMKA